MREILFRGKRIDNGEWVEGYYYNRWTKDSYILSSSDEQHYKVDPETVGQYIELKDKNGTNIFEDDIVTDGVFNYLVKFCYGMWSLTKTDDDETWESSLFHISEHREIIGNIHDNPELLERKG